MIWMKAGRRSSKSSQGYQHACRSWSLRVCRSDRCSYRKETSSPGNLRRNKTTTLSLCLLELVRSAPRKRLVFGGSMERYELGNVIAERRLTLIDRGEIIIKIGSPQAFAEDPSYFCPYTITFLGDESLMRARGIDA